MQINSPILYIEINSFDFVFIVGDSDLNNNFKLIYSKKIPQEGISENKITNLDLIYKIIKDNIYSIEQKINFIFKDVILIIKDFNNSIINFTGYKKLNGTQLDKDNVTYILNSLKSKVNEIEKQKKIIHIFNSKYILDKKNIDNLPIGLFGNFYSQELSFFLIERNDYNNLKNIFDKCSLKITKIISKNFLEGTKIINEKPDAETFFKIDIGENIIDISFFENSALKFSQKFQFGTNLILNDISKIIALDRKTVKNILKNSNLSENNTENDFVEKNFFENLNFRKIKKKLLYDVARARIQELAEIIILKNINLKSYLKKNLLIYLCINDSFSLNCLQKIYLFEFSKQNEFKVNSIKSLSVEEIYQSANNLVQYGWKKEAVPIIQEKKSFIARFFDPIFN